MIIEIDYSNINNTQHQIYQSQQKTS